MLKRWLVLIVGLNAALILAVIYVLKADIGKPKKQLFRDPYYEEEVFEKPHDIIDIATSSAKVVRRKVPIVMYHYVDYPKEDYDRMRKSLTMLPSVLDNQIETLIRKSYVTYFVSDVEAILQEKDFSKKPVVLTFDDGYEDFYYQVLPILMKRRAKATLYVITNYIGRTGFLTKKELEEIIESGLVEIGAHTLDHAYLKGMSETMAFEQILESKNKLEELFNIKVTSFAYPYGAFDSKTADLVRQAKFANAVTVVKGIYQTDEELFFLNRIRAGSLGTGDHITSVLEKD